MCHNSDNSRKYSLMDPRAPEKIAAEQANILSVSVPVISTVDLRPTSSGFGCYFTAPSPQERSKQKILNH